VTDTQSAFRFGLSGSAFGDINEIVDAAVRGERAGFDTYVVPDLGVTGALSPLITLAAVARATTTLGLGTFVLNTGLWNPGTIARELATLDQVSGGRVEINLGTGIPMPAARGVIPADRQARFARLTDTVTAVKAAFAEPGLSPGFTGKKKILVAGGSDRVLRLAAEEADGFILASVPPVPKVRLPQGHMVLPERAATEEFLGRLRDYAGDRADQLELSVGLPLVITDDAEAEAAKLAEIHTYLTPQQILASPKILLGTVDEIAAAIIDRGKTLGITYNILRGAEPEVLGEVIRKVRESALFHSRRVLRRGTSAGGHDGERRAGRAEGQGHAVGRRRQVDRRRQSPGRAAYLRGPRPAVLQRRHGARADGRRHSLGRLR
jgi:probable F420-dependent oxidoreductase